jgi:phytoene desaturase
MELMTFNHCDNLTEIIAALKLSKRKRCLLQDFMARAKSNYDIAIKDLVYRPGVSPLELITQNRYESR